MTALYVEIDPYAAEWLRNLIKAGHIAPGVVDERSLSDLEPEYVGSFTQVHICAGIAVWSAALRAAGWRDDTPVWTASFPCQGFSVAGKGRGFADERHLWPFGHYLIEQCRPPVVFGEQVESPDGRAWLDLVQDDLEACGYAFGAAVSPAAGYGAPHIRHRTYFVADDDDDARSQGRRRMPERAAERAAGAGVVAGLVADDDDARLQKRSVADDGRGTVRHEGAPASQDGVFDGLAVAEDQRRREQPRNVSGEAKAHERATPGQGHGDAAGSDRAVGRLAVADGRQRDGIASGERCVIDGQEAGRQQSDGVVERRGEDRRPGPVNGHWRAADWLHCRDEKWRPVEPGTFPLAHGSPRRVGFVCAACAQVDQKNKNNEDLRALWQISGTSDGSVAAKILQSSMHGGSVYESPDVQRGRPLSSATHVSCNRVRALPEDGSLLASAPQGPRPDEQHAREHNDSVRGVPFERAPEDACVRCGKQSDWLAEAATYPNRVGRLRAYGNGLVLPQATAFIRTYLDTLDNRS